MSTNMQILSGEAAVAEGNANPGEGGYGRVNPANPAYFARIAEAWGIWDKAVNGRSDLGRHRLREALSTSDFPMFLTAAFDRQALARYEDITPVWSSFADRAQVNDFRRRSFVDLMGGKSILERVPQGGEYPARNVTETGYEIGVGKFGGRFHLTWETFVNDDLGAFNDLPGLLSAGARDTEDYLATGLLVRDGTDQGAAGVNTAFFNAGNGNAVQSAALTSANLEAAITAVKTRKDGQGRPIVTQRGLTLVVPTALESTARRILNASEIRTTDGDTTVIEPNYMRGTVALVVNPWLDVIWTGAAVHRTWFLVPTPGQARRALALGFLRGHEVPDLRVKSDQGRRVGGGDVPADEGSFDDDTHQIRARHVLGAAHMDPMATYASTGPSGG